MGVPPRTATTDSSISSNTSSSSNNNNNNNNNNSFWQGGTMGKGLGRKQPYRVRVTKEARRTTCNNLQRNFPNSSSSSTPHIICSSRSAMLV